MAQSLLFDAIEAIWAEAISQDLLCIEGAPGFCPSHLETHRMHYASLALWPMSAHSTKKPLLSAVRKLHLSYLSPVRQALPGGTQGQCKALLWSLQLKHRAFVPRVDALRPV